MKLEIEHAMQVYHQQEWRHIGLLVARVLTAC